MNWKAPLTMFILGVLAGYIGSRELDKTPLRNLPKLRLG